MDYGGVEADPGHGRERHAIASRPLAHRQVNQTLVGPETDPEGGVETGRQPQCPSEQVGRTSGDDSQRGAGISQRVGARPDGPVASYSEDEPLARRPRVPA